MCDSVYRGFHPGLCCVGGVSGEWNRARGGVPRLDGLDCRCLWEIESIVFGKIWY
ncbi:hypothetical protein WN55_00450 [Dufourea novaeangliae]|uniref:Uncharacterized protein n=1 Tax=Dufourea novaeangliae TaxID=178035 RepID=A0A154PEF4_DUFNO|nr:hypothetical protein WN55_00450 [Dufourea novaeangliae]